MNKRVLNIVVIFLCLVLFIFPVIFSYESAYAYTLPSENPFGLSAEEARKIVNEHDVIYGSNKEPYFVYMNDVKAWKCITDISAFDTQLTDDQVVDILSSVNTFQYAVTAGQFLNVSSQIFKGLGYLTGGVTDAFLNLLKSNGGELTKGMTYDENNGITILSDTVDKLREEIKKQYYASIGMLEVKPRSNVKTLLSKSGFKAMFEETDDYNDTYARVNNYAYAFVCGYEYSSMTCYRTFFMNELPKYLYLDTTDTKGYSYYDSWYQCYRLAYYDDTSHAFSFNNSVDVYTYHYADSITPLSDMSLYYSFSRGFCYFPSFNTSDYDHSYYKEFMYFGNSSFWFFKSFEALYDYLHGDQNAYLSSKVEEAGEDIKISIDDMNTNISDKMDSLIDSINSKKDGMSADELQNAIDKGLESISGKMDDIKDNTEETNTKLDTLLSAMQSQNEILMNILCVTTDIYNVVSSNNKEDGTNYTIADLQPHFNKCFTAVKNMVLYGESSFEDVCTQSVMNVDNDVGIAVYADDPENHVKDYHNGLLGKFPFCVPYQLYEWLQVLQADPKTPEFTYDYGYMLKYFGVSSDTDTVIKFDLSQYDEWAKNARSFLKLSFTLALAVGTYRKFKGEI